MEGRSSIPATCIYPARENGRRGSMRFIAAERARDERGGLFIEIHILRTIYIYIYIGSIKRGEACFEVEFEVGREESTL